MSAEQDMSQYFNNDGSPRTDWHELDEPDGSVESDFVAWRDSLPATHWARYDISACRLGWDAAMKLNGILNDKVNELEETLSLRYRADMRAIKMWQAAHPDRQWVWPDHADLVVWLLDELWDTNPFPPNTSDQGHSPAK